MATERSNIRPNRTLSPTEQATWLMWQVALGAINPIEVLQDPETLDIKTAAEMGRDFADLDNLFEDR